MEAAMDEQNKIRIAKQRFARGLDGLTVAEIADQAVRAFITMSEEAERLAIENDKLRKTAA